MIQTGERNMDGPQGRAGMRIIGEQEKKKKKVVFNFKKIQKHLTIDNFLMCV